MKKPTTPTEPPPIDQASKPALDQRTLDTILAANLANLVRKVKSGRPLTKSERELLEASKNIPAQSGPHTFGQKSNGKKATVAEIEERIEFIAGMLLGDAKKHEIRRDVQARWSVHWVTCDRYTIRAKALLAKRAKIDADEARCIGIHALRKILATGKPSEVIQAERNWREIFGYGAPTRIEDTRNPGNGISISGQPVGPIVHLILPAGRAAGLMNCEPAPRPPDSPLEEPAAMLVTLPAGTGRA